MVFRSPAVPDPPWRSKSMVWAGSVGRAGKKNYIYKLPIDRPTEALLVVVVVIGLRELALACECLPVLRRVRKRLGIASA